MKRIILLVLCSCFLFVACKKEKEIDQLANTTWESGRYNENTVHASAYGAVYYNDASVCRELLEFTDSKTVWRYITYYGMKVELISFSDYSINDNNLVIVDDTTHSYKIQSNKIEKYFLNGEADGIFYRK